MKNFRKAHLFRAVIILLAAISISVPFSAFTGTNTQSPLYQGIDRNNSDMVLAAIAAGADVNGVYNKDTMLCFALQSKRWDIAKLLIQSPRIDVNKRGTLVDRREENEWERTPLILASHFGQTDIVSLLLNKGADINARTRVNGSPLSRGFSPLMEAAGQNRLDTVRFLLAYKKKPNIFFQDRDGETAFWYAVRHQNLEMVKLLFNSGSKVNMPNYGGQSILTLTVLHKNYDVLDFLISKGADVNMIDKGRGTPLMTAIGFKNKNQSVVTRYLEKFLTFRPKVNHLSADESALHLAARYGFIEAIKLLLDNRANINLVSLATGRTPLYVAAISKNIAAARFLMKQGAKTEIQDKMGYSPLTAAVTLVDVEMVEALLEGGASGDTRSAADVRATPLVLAAANINPINHNDYIKIMNKLLDRRAGVDFQSVNGTTALMAAALNSNQEMGLEKVELLIKRGSNLNIANSGGETALMLAAGAGKERIVKILLSKGAKIHLKNRAGETVMSYANRSGNRTIIELLKSRGAIQDGPLVMNKIIIAELIGTWQGYQDGLPQAVFTFVFYRNNTFDFVSRIAPAVLKQFPAGTMNPVIAAQKGTYSFNNDILILSISGAAPISRRWKLENKMLILDNIIKLRKIR